MTHRVILGNKNGAMGMWVSAPGKDALSSTTPSDFLVDTTRLNLRPVMAGTIIAPSLPYVAGASYPATTATSGGVVEVAPGNAVYYKDYMHNLGYKPICFFSIGSVYAGEIYPTIQILSDRIRLFYQQQQPVDNSQQYNNFVYNSYTKGYNNNPWKPMCDYPASISYNCTINYVIYGKSTGL
jgi:hypothetical protein